MFPFYFHSNGVISHTCNGEYDEVSDKKETLQNAVFT